MLLVEGGLVGWGGSSPSPSRSDGVRLLLLSVKDPLIFNTQSPTGRNSGVDFLTIPIFRSDTDLKMWHFPFVRQWVILWFCYQNQSCVLILIGGIRPASWVVIFRWARPTNIFFSILRFYEYEYDLIWLMIKLNFFEVIDYIFET